MNLEVAIVGSGFSGLAMASRLRKEGFEDFAVLERSDRVGGTWRDNTYPGCQCDVPSHLYQLSFALNPEWPRTYSMQPDIQAYLERVAADHDLLRYVRFGVDVTDQRWDEGAQRWRLATSAGEVTARYVVGAIGGLNEPAFPDIAGLESFAGPAFHSAQWDHSVALEGKRVAVIGTGASAVQIIPRIQPDVAELQVYQRTPTWIMPHTDRALTPLEQRLYRRLPAAQRLVRRAIYWLHETRALGFAKNPKLLGPAEKIGHGHLARQVKDPGLRDRLRPDYRLGCKRVTMSNTYYPALQQDNVELVTDLITEIRPRSIVTADGRERGVDVIVFATGFNIHNHSAYEKVHGRGGVSLQETWHGGPNAYLGSMVPGFPNLFFLLGPNSGTGHTSVVLIAEAQAGHVVRCLRAVKQQRAATIEVRPEVHDAYQEDLHRRMRPTVWNAGGCRSWYLDASGRNRVIYPDFSWEFIRRTKRFDPAAFVIEPGRDAVRKLAA